MPRLRLLPSLLNRTTATPALPPTHARTLQNADIIFQAGRLRRRAGVSPSQVDGSASTLTGLQAWHRSDCKKVLIDSGAGTVRGTWGNQTACTGPMPLFPPDAYALDPQTAAVETPAELTQDFIDTYNNGSYGVYIEFEFTSANWAVMRFPHPAFIDGFRGAGNAAGAPSDITDWYDFLVGTPGLWPADWSLLSSYADDGTALGREPGNKITGAWADIHAHEDYENWLDVIGTGTCKITWLQRAPNWDGGIYTNSQISYGELEATGGGGIGGTPIVVTQAPLTSYKFTLSTAANKVMRMRIHDELTY